MNIDPENYMYTGTLKTLNFETSIKDKIKEKEGEKTKAIARQSIASWHLTRVINTDFNDETYPKN